MRACNEMFSQSYVLRGKRILVLLEETGYPDLGIVDEVVTGLKLVGSAGKSDAFPSGLYPAQQTVDQLSQQSIWRRKSTIGKCRSSDDAGGQPKKIQKSHCVTAKVLH